MVASRRRPVSAPLLFWLGMGKSKGKRKSTQESKVGKGVKLDDSVFEEEKSSIPDLSAKGYRSKFVSEPEPPVFLEKDVKGTPSPKPRTAASFSVLK